MSQRNAGIDLLRGAAILLVVLSHIGLRIPLAKTALGTIVPPQVLQALTSNGYESVFVFFVISGFLIAGNTLRRWGSLAAVDLRDFYRRRFARIAPCLIALVLVLSALHLLGFEDYAISGEGQSLPSAVLAAIGMHVNWYEGRHGYLPGNWDVLWSLSIEEVFYLGFPVVCVVTRRRWVLVPLLALLAASLPWTHAALKGNEIWQEKAYLPGMAAIAVGILAALIAAWWRAPPRRTLTLLGWLGTIGLLLVIFDGAAVWKLFHDGYLLLLALSSAFVLLMFHGRRAGRGWCSSGALRWLRSWGRLSYEIYLSHMFVVYGLVRLSRAANSDPASGWLWYMAALPACWLLGAAIERWFSMPCERWLRTRWSNDLLHFPGTCR